MQSGHLEHMGLLRFSGPDAAQFLQGQLSQDTRRLAAGRTLLAAYSSAQGRVLAILHLLPHSSGILAVLPRELAAPTLDRLRKFVLRAKVQIENLSDAWWVSGYHDAAALRAAGHEAPSGVGGGDAGVAAGGDAGGGVAAVAADPARFWVVSPLSGQPAAPAAPAAAAVEHDWRLADIRAGLPQIYAATSELFVAQMLNLDLLDAISFSKGCYTGQEIIARTQHLGRIKRRTLRVALPPGAWPPGETMQLADGRGGRLIDCASVDGGCEALAVVSLEPGEPEPPPARVGVPLPLPYALTPDAPTGR